MAKQNQKQKGAANKHVIAAAELQKKKKTQLIKLVCAAAGGVLLWALYSFVLHDIMPNQQLDSIMVFASALILVIFIGEVGNKYANCKSELRKLMSLHGVTQEQIDKYIANH